MNIPAVTHSLSPLGPSQQSPGRGPLTFLIENCLIKPTRGKAGETGHREEEEQSGARNKDDK